MIVSRPRFAVLLLALLMPGGCGSDHESSEDRQADQGGPEPLGIVHINRRLTQPDCDSACSSITVDSLRLDNAPALSRELEQRLVRLGTPPGADATGDSEDNQLPQTFEGYATQFFKAAAADHADTDQLAPYKTQFAAKVAAEHDELLVIELDAWVFTGGAHGMPLSRYLVIDQRTRQVVSLDDMLRDGRHDAFNEALKAAHQRWLDTVDGQLDASDWPFVPSDNVAPMDDDVVVKYQVYDLAPFAVGQPQLHIPYSDLTGIFRARFLPNMP